LGLIGCVSHGRGAPARKICLRSPRIEGYEGSNARAVAMYGEPQGEKQPVRFLTAPAFHNERQPALQGNKPNAIATTMISMHRAKAHFRVYF